LELLSTSTSGRSLKRCKRWACKPWMPRHKRCGLPPISTKVMVGIAQSLFQSLWTPATHAIYGKCSVTCFPPCCCCSPGRSIPCLKKTAVGRPDRLSAKSVMNQFGFVGLRLCSATAASISNCRTANSDLSLTVTEGICSKCLVRKGWFCYPRDIAAIPYIRRAGFRMLLKATRAGYASTVGRHHELL